MVIFKTMFVQSFVFLFLFHRLHCDVSAENKYYSVA